MIEPLEYRESKKVREFVIAIDTSASCDGEAVKAFLRKTYAILKSHDNFFTQINVHILQCDNQVQEDRKITGQEDLETFLRECGGGVVRRCRNRLITESKVYGRQT